MVSPSESCEEKSAPCFSLASDGLLAIFGIPWLVDITLIDLFMFTWHSSCVHVCLKISLFHKDTTLLQ